MSGKAISLACEEYVYSLEAIEEYIGEKIPVIWPDEDWLLPDKAGRFRAPDRRKMGHKRKGSPPRRKRSAPRSRRGPRKKKKPRA
jgi:ATP-dependent RNA helicase RhlB